MPFTEAEQRRWHEDRRGGNQTGNGLESDSVECSHCHNPFPASQGLVTPGFALCNVCNDRD